MPQEPDYKADYEILDQALREADRVLRQAHLRTSCASSSRPASWTQRTRHPNSSVKRGPLPLG